MGIQPVRASPTAYAYPQPAFCTVPNSACENRQVYIGAGALGTTDSNAATPGLRIAVSFSIPNTNIIQTDNELGACIIAYVPTHYPEDYNTVGRDYQYYGCVDVDNGGAISFVSSSWITCEWSNCNTNSANGCLPTFCTNPIQQYNQSDCLTSGNWNTCPDQQHWQLWHSRIVCSGCRVTDNYLIEMTWVTGVPNPYAQWNYYQNGNVLSGTSFTQRSDWQVGSSYKYEYGTVGCTQCQWSHYHFGVTSLYDVGSSGWHVDMANPQYMSSDGQSWLLLPTVSYAGAQWAFTDQKYVLGGIAYPNMAVTSSVDTANCAEKVTFTDTGNPGSAPPWTSLWTNVNSGCSVLVHPPNFTVSASPASLTIPSGSEQHTSITLTSVNGFSGTVHLVENPSSSSVSCWFTTLTSSIDLFVPSGGSVSNSPACTGGSAGSYSVTMTGTSGSLSNSAVVPITITDFSMASQNISFPAGSSASGTVTLTSLQGFTGTVNLSVSAPTGVTASCPASANVPSGGTATPSCSYSSSTSGIYSVTISASYTPTDQYYNAPITHSTTINVSVQDFVLSENPTFQAIPVGSEQQTLLVVTSINNFAGNVNLVATPSSTAVSCWFSGTLTNMATVYVPPGGSGSQSPTCTGGPAGQYTVQFTGTSGSLSHFLVLNVNVTDFSMFVAPTLAFNPIGTSAIGHSAGGPFALAPGGLLGISNSMTDHQLTNTFKLFTFTFPTSQQASVTSGQVIYVALLDTNTLLNANTNLAAAPNQNQEDCSFNTSTFAVSGCYYQFQCAGTYANLCDGYTLTGPISPVSFPTGSSASNTFHLTSLDGFSGTVALSVSSPSAVSVSCPSSVNLSSTSILTVSCSYSSSSPGTYTVTIGGSFTCTNCYYGAQISHSLTISVNVGDFSITTSPTSTSISRGSTTTSTITLTSLYSFSGTIGLAISISPVTSHPPSASLSATTIILTANGSGTSTLSFRTTSNTSRSTYVVTISATSGSIVHTTTFTVTVN